jgi:hypothetical protein
MAAAAAGVARPTAEQRAAARLRGRRGEGVLAPGLHPQGLHVAARAVRSEAAEPAESLLGSVAEEEAAEQQACDEDEELHGYGLPGRVVVIAPR